LVIFVKTFDLSQPRVRCRVGSLAAFSLDFMDDRIAALLDDLRHAAELNGPARQRSRKRAAWLAELTPSQVLGFLDQLQRSLPLPLARPAL
jgi:hypothetical protein